MRLVRALTALALLVCSACVDVGFGQKSGADAGASSASGSSSDPNASGGADAGAQGVDCITEQATSATICTGISLCPGLVVDHDVYPDCGFRVKGNVLDLECACGSDVCPIGVPQTCTQAQSMLSSQSEGTVCAQVAEGRCTPGTPAPSSGGTTGGGSTCDKACEGECGGDPSCIQSCGC